MLIQQFRKTVYQSILKRADAFLDLLDALTVAGHISSPVALSEETPFRRKFSSVFDTLQNAELDFDQILSALYTHQTQDSELIEGYEVYGLDTTPNERPEAETLEDRVSLKSEKDEPVRYGHKHSWLTRLVNWGTSWVAPVDVRRVGASSTDGKTGAVQELDMRHPKPKVIDCSRQLIWQPYLPGSLSQGQTGMWSGASTQQYGILWSTRATTKGSEGCASQARGQVQAFCPISRG